MPPPSPAATSCEEHKPHHRSGCPQLALEHGGVTTRRGNGGNRNRSNCPAPAGTPQSALRVPSGDRHRSSTPDGALSSAHRGFLGRRDGTVTTDPRAGCSAGDRLPIHPCVLIRRDSPLRTQSVSELA